MTFIQNLGAFLDKTGIQNAPMAWFLAGVPWPDDVARDKFISTLDQQAS